MSFQATSLHASLWTFLLIVGLVCAAYILYRFWTARKLRQLQAVEATEAPDGSSLGVDHSLDQRLETVTVAEPEPWSHVLDDRPSYFARALQSGLILLAIVVAAGFTLILLPQHTLDRLVETVRATRAADLPSESIALLYLGDEIKGNEFHIRGVVRNISMAPISKLDATIRLYAPDHTLLETVVVRLNLDVIAPDETSEFHLVYPDYRGQFASYSADFKTRQGDVVPYKDRRGTKHLN